MNLVQEIADYLAVPYIEKIKQLESVNSQLLQANQKIKKELDTLKGKGKDV